MAKATIQVLLDGVYLESFGAETPNSYVGMALQYLRKSKDMTQTEVCVEIIAVGKSNFYKLEKGTAKITTDHLYMFARSLGTTPSDILILSDKIRNTFEGK